ncbi:MAG: flagellin [Clostridiales bacterium]|nr:flagellin [Clostridiales bacterium]
MIIQHNLMALNAYRQLSGNNLALSRNLEKLSSGYRINRAGDDAAGLAISEKMRAQIKGLDTAIKNAQDGISLIQTAEGALTEVHSMLNRMVELATMAANGIYDDQIDRKALDEEFQQLKQEIDRISQSTNFNGKNLLDGTLSLNGTTGSAATMMATLKILGDVPKDVLKTVKGDLVYATGTEYRIQGDAPASHTGDSSITTTGESLEKTLLDAGLLTSGATYTKADWQSAVAEYLGIEEADYTWTVTGENTPASMVITFVARDPGADDPNSAKILEKGEGFAYVSKAGTDKYNMIDLKVGVKAGDLSLIGQQIEINGKVYKFVGDWDKVKDGTTAIGTLNAASQNGVQLNDDTYSIYIGTLNTASDDASAQNIVATAIQNAIRNVESTGATWDITTGEITPGTINASPTTVTSGVADGGGLASANGAIVTIDPTKFAVKTVNSVPSGGGLNLQIGDTGDKFNVITVGVENMGTKGLKIDNLNIASYEAAVAAVGTVAQQGDPGTIKGAINIVSAQRATLGALQNRLEHTINNLGVTVENVTAAESRIRDTDMAKEMMEYTKNNILVQAAQAMLAQANMVPQGVLQLLR